VLTGDSIDAHNTFEDPEAVKPAALAVDREAGGLGVSLPPRSVSVVTVSRH
jgi:alpha-N-arabinofuranosidase